MRWPARPPAQRDPNPAASMALLDEVLDPPLGPGYHSAAQAREAAGLPTSSGMNTLLMLLTALVFGFLITVAAMALRTPDPVAAQTRAELADRIEAAQVVGDEERAKVEQLRAEILALEQAQAASDSGRAGAEAIAEAGMEAGALAVTGPGVTVTLADAPRPAADPQPSDKAPERVNARDITLVVNGLWGAGAEAMSINGHRLTSTSAIRFAGQAIIVDFRGLTPPYEIVAVGDPARLKDELTAGVTGAYLSELRTQLGLQTAYTTGDALQIGPAERLTTRIGRVPDPLTTSEANP